MARLLNTRGSPGVTRMMVADFDGLVRDGATFKIRGSLQTIRDGDLIAFNYPDGLAAGISVDADADGLYSLIPFSPAVMLPIGLEPRDNGVFAFRPAPNDIELWPELGANGKGAPIHK